jgi:hypothetical protein
MRIARLLREFEFSNYGGSSFGEPVEISFGFYVNQLGLADVRYSREKTLEAVILGEQMKSVELYCQGFAHAVGKYAAILDIKSPLYQNVSSSTRNRLERAHLDLLNRQSNINTRLESFEFPSLFAGIALSTSYEEYRNVRYKEWKNAFARMRAFFMGYYKDLFGHWPPKARSKKNQFSESGLNRQCLKILYSDLCALYDLLVDRESLTPRVIDQSPEDIQESSGDPRLSALRKMLSEYDHSSPPVLPPIPYDVPKLPSMTSIREDYNALPAKQQTKFDRSIQPNEFMIMMVKSHNIDTEQLQVPFLSAFKEFERREAKGSSPQDMADQRIGHWLFLYVVIQCLPMLVIDAPGLHFTEGVEYFLCEPPQGNMPWMDDAGEVRKVWYEVSGGQNIVELSADVVMFSVEATYHRSHCWLAAKAWESTVPAMAPQPAVPMSPLEPPRPAFQDLEPLAVPGPSSPLSGSGASSPQLLPRTSSPAGRRVVSGWTPGPGSNQHHRLSSIALGLEPLPSPPDRHASGDYTSVSTRNSLHGSFSNAHPPPHLLSKSSSVGNLGQLARDSAHPPLPSSSTSSRPGSEVVSTSTASIGGGSSTFDDILKGIGTDKSKKKRFGF